MRLMKANALKSSYHPIQSFVGVLLAFSLFGLFHPDQVKYKSGRGDRKVVHFNRLQQSNGDSIYSPPRSPGFNELAGG